MFYLFYLHFRAKLQLSVQCSHWKCVFKVVFLSCCCWVFPSQRLSRYKMSQTLITGLSAYTCRENKHLLHFSHINQECHCRAILLANKGQAVISQITAVLPHETIIVLPRVCQNPSKRSHLVETFWQAHRSFQTHTMEGTVIWIFTQTEHRWLTATGMDYCKSNTNTFIHPDRMHRATVTIRSAGFSCIFCNDASLVRSLLMCVEYITTADVLFTMFINLSIKRRRKTA